MNVIEHKKKVSILKLFFQFTVVVYVTIASAVDHPNYCENKYNCQGEKHVGCDNPLWDGVSFDEEFFFLISFFFPLYSHQKKAPFQHFLTNDIFLDKFRVSDRNAKTLRFQTLHVSFKTLSSMYLISIEIKLRWAKLRIMTQPTEWQRWRGTGIWPILLS